jgi:hypothetical protein
VWCHSGMRQRYQLGGLTRWDQHLNIRHHRYRTIEWRCWWMRQNCFLQSNHRIHHRRNHSLVLGRWWNHRIIMYS